MYHLAIRGPVWTSGRADQGAATSADCTVSLPEVSFDRDDHEGANRESYAHAGRIATVKQVLRSTKANIHRSSALIAALQDSISETFQKIRTSQLLIYASDLAIARAKSLDCK